MKHTITLASLLFSSMAFACPDLAGTYSCVEDGKPLTMHIGQENDLGTMTFTLDGRSYQIGYSETVNEQNDLGSFVGTQLASCARGSVLINKNGQYFDGNQFTGDGSQIDLINWDSISLVWKTHQLYSNKGGEMASFRRRVCSRI